MTSDVEVVGDTQYDSDDQIRYFGHAANAYDNKAVTSVIEHFYAAAAEENGMRACALVDSVFVKAVVEMYDTPYVPAAMHGKTCAVVMFKRFRQLHREYLREHWSLKVLSVRIQGATAVALLRFSEPPIDYIYALREHGAWRLAKFDYPLR